MRMWGIPAHTYTWGMQGVEPELGTSNLNDLIFMVDEDSGDIFGLEPILEEYDDGDKEQAELLSFDPSCA